MTHHTTPWPQGWDCHIHVFDAAAPAQQGHYQPTTRSLGEIEATALAVGVGHLVLVQPSVYGTDNTLLLQALAREPGRHRGVVVIDSSITEAELNHMHHLGVRGVRFNLVSPVGNGAADLPALAPRLRERGWHVQWYAHPNQLDMVLQAHQQTGLVPVLDHLAGLGTRVPLTDPAWVALRRLADQGAWVKLSAWYRLHSQLPHSDLHGHIQEVAHLLGDHLVWGSDWPHTAFAESMAPPYGEQLSPVAKALGADRTKAVLAAGTRLYA